MESYNFIKDEKELKRFHSLMPQLKENECYYIMIGARRKYLSESEKDVYNMNGTDMIRRVLVRKNEYENFRRKILEFCVPRGAYCDKNGRAIPEHAFTIYMTENPRDMKKASVSVISKLAEKLYMNHDTNLHEFVLSEIHKSPSKKTFMDFDIDPKDDDDLMEMFDDVKSCLGESETINVATKTGMHVMLNKETLDPKIKHSFYQHIQQLNYSGKYKGDIEILSDGMIPIPGTSQGGGCPFIIN